MKWQAPGQVRYRRWEVKKMGAREKQEVEQQVGKRWEGAKKVGGTERGEETLTGSMLDTADLFRGARGH